jgi:hypothetical protein
LTATAAILSISGCTSSPEPLPFAAPDYIGTTCDGTEISRIVRPKEMYAVCLGNQWVMVAGDQFGIYKSLLENPVRRPDFVMKVPYVIQAAKGKDLCIRVIELEVGWADVENDGTVLRLPLVDGSCSFTPCDSTASAYQPDVCQ